MPGPLEGFQVIDLCRVGPGLMATGTLADYGADVVSVLDPAQYRKPDPAASFRNIRRNKRSIFLNLKTDAARSVFLRLAGGTDAILESNRPGVVQKLGVDYGTVSRVNPTIVYLSLSGFGQTGPYSRIAAHDLTYQGVAGMIPQDEQGNLQFPNYIGADYFAAHHAAIALLMGLLARSKTGEGQYIDVAFSDVALTVPPGRMEAGGFLEGKAPGYYFYETADGRFLTVSNVEPPFWERLCKLIGKPEWIPQYQPVEPLRSEMRRFLAAYFRTRPLSDWMEVLTREDIQFGPVNRTIAELKADPQLRSREMLSESSDSGGGRMEPGFGMKFQGTPPKITRNGSAPGAETDSILTGLKYTDAEIAVLHTSGALG